MTEQEKWYQFCMPCQHLYKSADDVDTVYCEIQDYRDCTRRKEIEEMSKIGYDFEDIKSQSQFCTELMLRLNKSIKTAELGSSGGIDRYCQKQDDVIRIRRELNTLREMLNPWAERKEDADS